MTLSGREKATILLSLLGPELAERILSFLPEDLADLITGGINRLPTPSSDAIKTVLDEFAGFVALPEGPSEERLPHLREDFVKTDQESPPAQNNASDQVLYSHPKKLAMALSSERTPVCAYVLSLMPAVASAEVLSLMPERRREIESLMRALKKPPIAEKLDEELLKTLAEKMERMSV